MSDFLTFRNFIFFLHICFLVWSSSLELCSARRGKHWEHSRAANGIHGDTTKSKSSAPSKLKAPSPPQKRCTAAIEETPAPPSDGYNFGHSAVFDVLDFGAKGDGDTDDTKLDGTIIAPTSSNAWGSGLGQWLLFSKLKGITVRGGGIIDGRGSVWWTDQSLNDPIDAETKLIAPIDRNPLHNTSQLPMSNKKLSGKMPSLKPTALRFYGSFEVTVTGIAIQNSPQCHLKFDNCVGVEVFNMSVSSAGDSLNTDGIHLQNSKDVLIRGSNLACGDDCVSIQTGCSNVCIQNVSCGPGHGISIGGLGKENTKACVSNITVRDTRMQNTMTGVRIKTWQGGSGSVQGILFSNIQVSEVQLPIVIDQFYCDGGTCKNQTSAVALSGITYERIRGTYTAKPVHFACSDSSPCAQVTLTDIELTPLQEKYQIYDPFCWKTFGELSTPTVPPINCLQIGKPPGNQIQSNHDYC